MWRATASSDLVTDTAVPDPGQPPTQAATSQRTAAMAARSTRWLISIERFGCRRRRRNFFGNPIMSRQSTATTAELHIPGLLSMATRDRSHTDYGARQKRLGSSYHSARDIRLKAPQL